MPRDAAARNILIHHPAAHADEVVLGALTQLGNFDWIELEAALGEQGVRDRDLDRRRGTQARPDRDIAPDDEVGAGKVAPAPLEYQRDAENVVRPVAARALSRSVEIELACLVHDHGINPE